MQSSIKLLGKIAARESGLAKKNIVRYEGTEKDSIKKIFPTGNHPPPQPKVKWSAPNYMEIALLYFR